MSKAGSKDNHLREVQSAYENSGKKCEATVSRDSEGNVLGVPLFLDEAQLQTAGVNVTEATAINYKAVEGGLVVYATDI